MKLVNVKKVQETPNTVAADIDRIMKNPEDPLIALGVLTADDKIQFQAIFCVKGDILKLTEMWIELAKRDPVYVGKIMQLLKAVIEAVDSSAAEPNG